MAEVFWNDEALAAHVLRSLPVPWCVGQLAACCRAWRSLTENCRDVWATLVPRGQTSLPALGAAMRKAGSRLRRLDLSQLGRGIGTMPGIPEALLACKNLDDLDVSGLESLSFDSCPGLCAKLAQSLRRLNIRGCNALHQQLPELVGPSLRYLHAGWMSECEDGLDPYEWSRVFPSGLFSQICERSPNLTVLRVPGYILMPRNRGSMEDRAAILADYTMLGVISSLSRLQRLDLCCAQLLPDNSMLLIVDGCKRLSDLNLRICQRLSDRSLLGIAEGLAGTLRRINVSCCNFTDRSVRALMMRCRLLRVLDLCYCSSLSADLVRFLCSDASFCPRLKMLGVGGLDVGDEEMALVCEKYGDTMEHLGVGSASRLTDVGLMRLARIPRLRRLSAHRLSSVSAAGLIAFCSQAESLKAIDAEHATFATPPTIGEEESLNTCLAARPYSYNDSDTESDEEVEYAKDVRIATNSSDGLSEGITDME